MKKLLLLLLLSFSVWGANPVEKTFGLFGGLSLSSISYENATPSGDRNGILLGVDLEFPLADHFFLAPSLFVVEKGESTTLGKTNLNYIELALAPKYKTSTDATGLYFLMGPYIASILSRTAVSTAGTETPLTSNQIKNTEGGIVGGMGFEFLIAHHWTMYLEGRYSYGISRAVETNPGSNRSIYLVLGFHYLEREDIESNSDRAEEFVKKKSGEGGKEVPTNPVNSGLF